MIYWCLQLQIPNYAILRLWRSTDTFCKNDYIFVYDQIYNNIITEQKRVRQKFERFSLKPHLPSLYLEFGILRARNIKESQTVLFANFQLLRFLEEDIKQPCPVHLARSQGYTGMEYLRFEHILSDGIENLGMYVELAYEKGYM